MNRRGATRNERLFSCEEIYLKSSHGGWSQPTASGSQECSPWDHMLDFLRGPLHSEERRGCSDYYNSDPQRLGENGSLVAFRETTRGHRGLILTIVIHRLAGVDLRSDEIHLPKERK